MAFRRALVAAALPDADALTADMVGIGMNLGASPGDPDANIEDTLLYASEEGMEKNDLRVLAVLVTWLGVHAARVNADRLSKIVRAHKSPRVRAFWSAVGRWLVKDRRLARLAEDYRGPRVDLLSAGTDFQVRRRGEDPRFAGTPLRVPANVLRDRAVDVLSPAEVARRHAAYRWRLVIGPTYRADMWAALERDSELSAAELARRTYGSFATAWHAVKDFRSWDACRRPTGARERHSPSPETRPRTR
jgi:hypothetical protein